MRFHVARVTGTGDAQLHTFVTAAAGAVVHDIPDVAGPAATVLVVQLTDEDKLNIANMGEEYTLYAAFDDSVSPDVVKPILDMIAELPT